MDILTNFVPWKRSTVNGILMMLQCLASLSGHPYQFCSTEKGINVIAMLHAYSPILAFFSFFSQMEETRYKSNQSAVFLSTKITFQRLKAGVERDEPTTF